MVDSIDIFKQLASNKAFRNLLLGPLDRVCDKDGNILDMVISRYINPDLEVCSKCKLKSNLANKLLDKVADGLNISQDKLRKQLTYPPFQRGLKGVIKAIKKYGFQKPFLPSTPFLVIWNFTKLCNSNCKHCCQNAGKKANDELNLDQQFKVIDNLANWGITFLSFSGGEPLAHPDFYKLAEYASKKEIVLALSTNGTLITKESAKKLKELGFGFVEVSLDSLNPKEHDEFRGIEGGWEKAVIGIKNLVKAGVPTCIITLIHKNNYKKIPEFVEFAKELGVPFWAMADYKPAGRAKDLDIDMNPEEREEALKILSEVTLKELKNRKEKKPFVFIDTSAPQFGRKMRDLLNKEEGAWGHYGFLINSSLLLEIVGGCAAGRIYLALQQNGNFTPCIYMPDLVVGNVLTDDLDKLWSNNQILKNIRDRDKFEGHCSECKFKYICGGCRARAYGYLGDVIKPDIGCIYNNEY